MSRRIPSFPWSAIFAGCAAYSVIQLCFIGLPSFIGGSEAREAQVIEVILRSNEWVLPLRNGIIPSKPPLFHWTGAALALIAGGVSEFLARLPSHLYALGVLVCCGYVAYQLALLGRASEGSQHARRAAMLAPGILALTYGFHQMASLAVVDMSFCFCAWAAFGALLWSIRGPHEGAASQLGRGMFWILCALGILARGPLGGALIVLLAALGIAWVCGLREALRQLVQPSWGWLGFALPGCWYCLAWMRGGQAFLERQLIFENLARVLGGERVNSESWWFYLPSIARTSFPWGIIAMVGGASLLTSSPTVSYRDRPLSRLSSAPIVVFLGGLLALSLAQGKRHSYALPLLPLLAVQIGIMASAGIGRLPMAKLSRLQDIARRTEVALSLFAAALLAAVGLGMHVEWGHQPLEGILKAGLAQYSLRLGALMLPVLVLIGCCRKVRPSMVCGSVWLLALSLMTAAITFGGVVKATLKDFPLMTEQLELLLRPDERLVFIKEPSDEYFDPFFFYLHRPVRIISAEAALGACEEGALYVAHQEWFEQAFAGLPGRATQVALVQETLHALRRDGVRGISVFRCSPTSGRTLPMEGAWHEA